MFVVVFCGVASAGAADNSIATTFSVVDEQDQPVAQATVELRRDTQSLASAQTDATGKASLQVKGPGNYTLKVSKKDYLPTETALEVRAANAEQIQVVLSQVVLSQQSLNVEGTANNPVTESSAAKATLTAAQAANTPLKPPTLADALPLVPGVVRAPDGSVSIAGFGEKHSALLVNSVNVTDPATGEFGLSVPIDSVETISVAEMPYLAQYGRFTAGVVTAETRRGGDKWNFSLNDPLPDFRIRSAHLEGLKDASPRLNLSGPIIANRLYFLEGTEYLLYKKEVYTLPFPQNQTTSSAINSFTQVDAMVSPSQTLTASFHFAPHTLDYAGLNFFNPQPVTPDATFHESTGTIMDRWGFAGGMLQSTLATTQVSSGITPQGTADMVLTPVGNQGNYFSQETRHSTRFEWIENWTLRTRHFHGDHTFQIGSVVAHGENEGQFNARPVLIQDASGRLLERIDFTGGGSFNVLDTEPAIYAQDHWVAGSGLALDAGLRLESQTITATVRTAPRAGFVWTPTQSQKTVIRGGAGIFYDSVPLDIYAFSSYPQQSVTAFNPQGGVAGIIQYVNLTDQVTLKGFPFVSREAQSGNFAPYSLAWNLEVERSIYRLLMVRLKYLQSQAQDLITIQPQVVQGKSALVLGSAGIARTRQYELTTRIGGGLRQFFFSYVRQSARGDINDAAQYLGNFPYPVVRQTLIASLPTEIPNRFLLWGTYTLPKKFEIIPHIEYRNGFPYELTDAFQQYVPVENSPQPRFPRYFSLNMRLSKELRVAQKHAVRLSLNIVNLTNHFNALEVHSNLADPLYGNFFGNYTRRVTVDFDFLR
jgi:hypothetical protein